MIKMASSLSVTLFVLCLAAAPAQAQLARTFVSSLGNDANDCQRLTPCRTFQGAHDKTLANGEITVLDPGGYGAVTITKTISIINDGVGEAGALVSGGLNGITVSAGASDAVSLRGLTVKGIGFGGGNGIVFNSGRALAVENCAIRNLTAGGPGNIGYGILFGPSLASSLAVSGTLVSDSSSAGILIEPTGAAVAAVTATLTRLDIYNSGFAGILIREGTATNKTINAVIADAVLAKNGFNGILVRTGVSTTVAATLIRSILSHNTVGLSVVNAGTTVRLSQSTLTGNTTSWTATSGSQLISFGDNIISGNTDGDPAIPTVQPKK
jgi:hypothetical protein